MTTQHDDWVLLLDDSKSDAELFIQVAYSSSFVGKIELFSSAGGLLSLLDSYDSPEVSLIVMDIYVHDMDGLELIQKLKATEKYWHIPIVVFTGSSSPHDEKGALEAGASGYFQKPVNLKAYEKIVETILGYG